jgi:hypothetical protein
MQMQKKRTKLRLPSGERLLLPRLYLGAVAAKALCKILSVKLD